MILALRGPLLLATLLCASARGQEPPAGPAPEPAAAPAEKDKAPADVAAPRLDAEALRARLTALADAHPDLARVQSLGTSLGGRPLLALVLHEGSRPLQECQGALLVGGLDGRRLTDANVLLAAAEALLSDKDGDLRARLGDAALVIVPRANPDGAEALAGTVRPQHEQAGNGRADDADRDGRIDEDGPADLDGDGLIAWMAVPDGKGTWVFDEHDPRALRKARTERGERPTHRLLLEGRDADGDGVEDEDDTGGVLPDANFPFGWKEFAPTSGAYPLSEPESRALADFVLANPRLSAVLVVGAQDTLVALPKTATNAHGSAGISEPLDGLHENDVEGLKELQRRFAALGKQQHHEHAVKGDGLSAGSFLAWAYDQAGRWPVALKVWAPPEELPKPKGEDKKKEKNGKADEAGKDAEADKSAEADKGEDADASKAEAPKAGAGKSADAEKSDDDKPKSDASSPAPAAVLAWLDTARGGAGFVPWHAFTHDQLGEVQLGGLLPGLLFEAPQPRVDEVAGLLAPFALTLLECLPRVAFEGAKLTGEGGVYTLEVALVNRGVLPTRTQLSASARIGRPVHVSLELPADGARLAGPAHEFIERLSGGGGRRELRWVFTGARGGKLRLRAESESIAPVELELELP